MRKYIPIVFTAITWTIVLVYMLIILNEPVHRNLMFDNAGAAVVVFAYFSFWVSIINGIITGLCLTEAKEVKIPVIIHGVFTVIITICALFFHWETISYLVGYMFVCGVTGGLMAGVAIIVKLLRKVIAAGIVKARQESAVKPEEKEKKEGEVYVHRFGDRD